ncbi:MAG: hypothetical protein ACRC7O_18465, partial [Fimbriiglobus sp.]
AVAAVDGSQGRKPLVSGADRLRAPDVPGKVTEDLLGSSGVLCGLRYDPEQVAALYRSLSMILEDSTVYQWIHGKGKTQGLAEGLAEGRLTTIR